MEDSVHNAIIAFCPVCGFSGHPSSRGGRVHVIKNNTNGQVNGGSWFKADMNTFGCSHIDLQLLKTTLLLSFWECDYK